MLPFPRYIEAAVYRDGDEEETRSFESGDEFRSWLAGIEAEAESSSDRIEVWSHYHEHGDDDGDGGCGCDDYDKNWYPGGLTVFGDPDAPELYDHP
jgi:hypothetical protein